MKKYIFIAVFLIKTIGLTAQTGRFKDGEFLNVWATSGLNMRDKPDAKATKIVSIPYGAKVVVQPNIGIKISFEVEEFKGFTVKGFWLLVKYGDKEGFVFGGFLSRLPTPDKTKNKYLITYFEKEIGKVGDKYAVQIYDNVLDGYRLAKKDEKFEKDNLVGYKQKIAKGIIYELEPSYGSTTYKITLSNATFFEGYILLRTFFNVSDEVMGNMAKREFDKKKKVLHLSPIEEGAGCYFDIMEVDNNVVLDGFCGC